MLVHSKGILRIAGLILALSLCACAPGYHPGAKLSGVRVPSRAGAFQATQTKAAVIPPVGIFFGKSTAPLGVAAPGKPFGSRHGTSVAHSIGIPPLPIRGLMGGLTLFSWGDASVKTAQSDGGISEPSYSEYESMVVLMFYRRMKVTTYGE